MMILPFQFWAFLLLFALTMMLVRLPMGKTAPATPRKLPPIVYPWRIKAKIRVFSGQNVPVEVASMRDLAPEVSGCVAIVSVAQCLKKSTKKSHFLCLLEMGQIMDFLNTVALIMILKRIVYQGQSNNKPWFRFSWVQLRKNDFRKFHLFYQPHQPAKNLQLDDKQTQ